MFSQLHPIIENQRFHLGVSREIDAGHQPNVANVNSASQQLAEEIRCERITHDLSIAALISKAQAPDSPGGRNITPSEAAPIAAVVTDVVEVLTSDDKRAA